MMTLSEKIAYNNLPIPSLTHITQSEAYNSMTKFDMTERSIVTPNYWLFVPPKLVKQYTGKKYEEFNNRSDDRSRKEDINGLEFWYSIRGPVTKMIIVPGATSNVLKEMEDAKVFWNYFEEKILVHLSNALAKSFTLTGIESRFRKGKTKYKFQADNSIYVEVSKIIPSQTYNQLELDL